TEGGAGVEPQRKRTDCDELVHLGLPLQVKGVVADADVGAFSGGVRREVDAAGRIHRSNGLARLTVRSGRVAAQNHILSVARAAGDVDRTDQVTRGQAADVL